MLTETRTSVEATRSGFDLWWFVAAISVVLSVLAASLFAPDLITGSNQEHIPLAGLLDWFWGLVAIGYIGFVRRSRGDVTFGLSVAVLWLAVAVISIAAPMMVTGADPTRLPIAALTAPVVGCLATGFLALNAARTRDGG